MKYFAIAVAALVAVFCASPVSCSFGFTINDYINALFTLAGDYLTEGKCDTAFEPYSIRFDYQNTSYLLWVSNGSIPSFPDATMEGNAEWWGNSTYLHTYNNVDVANYTVYYNASLGTVTKNTFDSTNCVITASSTGYTMSSIKTWAKNYNGTTYIYKDSSNNWTNIDHTLDVKTFGTWKVSVTCDDASDGLTSQLLSVVEEVVLMKLRDVFHDVFHTCAYAVVKAVDITEYFVQ